MQITIEREGLRIETRWHDELEGAYVEEVLGLRKAGDAISLVRVAGPANVITLRAARRKELEGQERRA